MNTSQSNMDFKVKIEQIKELPSLPGIVKQLLLLQEKPNAATQQLTKILEADPILSAQILKYANSAFFNRSRRIESLDDAVNLIGFQVALNFAIAVTSASQFTIPMTGSIGMRSFWKHAIYSAHLMQKLAIQVPIEEKPLPGLAYLSGLLHNFGFVLLGHTFPKEFELLNHALEESNSENVLATEQLLLGVHHYELSAWLMRKWSLPREIMTAIFEHHNECYRGVYWQYANLTLLTDRILFNYGMGDAGNGDLPPRIIKALNLNPEQIMHCVERLFANTENIDSMIENTLSGV